jgi:hypothetical protein
MNLHRLAIVFAPLVAALCVGACTVTEVVDDNRNNNNKDGGTVNGDSGNSNQSDAGTDAEEPEPEPEGTKYEAKLSGYEEVPAVASTSTGTANFLLKDDGTLEYEIKHTVTETIAVNLHLAVAGDVGAVAKQITPVSQDMKGSIKLDDAEVEALQAGKMYLNITSARAAAGEIRGQVVQPGSTVFVAKLTGAQVVPAVNTTQSGSAAFILNESKDTIRYHIKTTAQVTDALIKRAIGGVAGATKYAMGPAGATIDGTENITSDDAEDLTAGRWYVSIQSQAHPTGELRGQILRPAEILYTAIMNGAAVVPPVSTAGNGGAQLILLPDGSKVKYEAVANTMIPTSANMHQGASGTNGAVMYNLTLGTPGAKGEQTVTAGDIAILNAGNGYIQFYSATFPNGEIRGQISRK